MREALRRRLITALLGDDLCWAPGTSCKWCGERLGSTELLHDMRMGLALPRMTTEEHEKFDHENDALLQRLGDLLSVQP